MSRDELCHYEENKNNDQMPLRGRISCQLSKWSGDQHNSKSIAEGKKTKKEEKRMCQINHFIDTAAHACKRD